VHAVSSATARMKAPHLTILIRLLLHLHEPPGSRSAIGLPADGVRYLQRCRPER
jgi:hypothetical protein